MKRAITWIFTCAPGFLLLVSLTQAAHLYLILGRRPRPVLDSPSGLAFVAHDWLVQLSLWLALVAPVLWLSAVLIARPPRRLVVSQLAILLVGYLAVFAFMASDPTGYVEWDLD
jgi:hypothetical protein